MKDHFASVTLKYFEKAIDNYGIANKHLKDFKCPICLTPVGAHFLPNGKGTMYCNVGCKNIGNLFDVMRKLKNMSAKDVIESVKQVTGENITHPEYESIILEEYSRLGWDMVPIVPKQKYPIEQAWPTQTHTVVSEWKSWIADGNNIGVKTGARSNITVVDIDSQEIPEILKPLLIDGLYQKTANGHHFFYQFTEELPTTRIDDLKIDILNNGKQCVVEPSITDGFRRKFAGDFELRPMPELLKNFLKGRISIPVKTLSEKLQNNEDLMESLPKDMISIKEGNRHNLFMHMGGVFRKELNAPQTAYVLDILNRKFCSPPLSYQEMRAVTNQLEKYINFDEKEIALKILNYLKVVEESNSRDIKESLGLQKVLVEKCLSFLVKEGYVLKRGTRFHVIKKADWKENFPKLDNKIPFEMPFFDDLAQTNWGDMILLGSKAKYGKTTISMNMLKSFVKQGIKPYYISLETGSRFIKTAINLQMREGDFYWAFHADPTKIELEPNAVTILDWLMIEDKSQTDAIMKHFTEQLYKTNGLLIVFMQLKTDGTWFAPNMVNQFPAISARYLYENENDGSKGHWKLDVIREPKNKSKSGIVLCQYDYDTRELRKVLNQTTEL